MKPDPEHEAAAVSQGAGLADLSWMVRLDLKGPGIDTLPAFGSRVRSWPLGPGHLLVTCGPSDRENVTAQLPGVWTTDVTSVYAHFLLAGPRSRDILAKLTSLNVSERALPDSGCARTSLAHVHSTILRQDLGALPAFHILVSRDYGEDTRESILHAGHEFALGAFGIAALRQLGAEVP